MPPVHKLIQGGELWLPFALSRLRALARIGLLWTSQTFTMPDGARVSVSIKNGEQFLRIDGGGGGYEFFTSEHIDGTLATPGAPPIVNEYGETYYPVLGSGMRYKSGQVNALFSSALPPDAENPKWLLIPAGEEAMHQSDPPNPFYTPGNPNYFKTWASWQNQRLTEYVWWPENKSDALVTSTAGISPGVMNMAGWLHAGALMQDSFSRAHDVGRDIVPAYYSKKDTFAGAPGLPTHIWWRRAAVQTVSSTQYGERKFFILTDTHGQFHVYPAKAYQTPALDAENDFTGLPGSMFKTYMPPYPVWVTLPDTGVENEYGQWFWTFNKDATKAVSLPFKREPASMWDGALSHPDDPLVFTLHDLYVKKDNTGFVANNDFYATLDPNLYRRAQEDTPGLVEFNIKITITGDGDLDFEVAFTLGRTEYFDDQKRYFVSAGYILGKAAENTDGAAQADDLVVAEVQAFWKPGNPTINIGGTEVAVEQRIARYRDGMTYPSGYEPDAATLSAYTEHQHEPGLSDMATGRFFMTNGTSMDAYFRVSNFDTGAQIMRFPIMAGETYGSPFNVLGLVTPTGFNPLIPTSEAQHVRTRIQNMDLRSLSFLLADTADKFNGPGDYYAIFRKRLITFNKERASTATHAINGVFADGIGPNAIEDLSTEVRPGFGNIVTTAKTEDLDCAFIILQSLALLVLDSEFTVSVAVHPNGSWSSAGPVFGDKNGDLDIIAPHNGKRTTHRAAFNKAFNQNRGYDFYGDVTGSGDGDLGSFCTTGIWVTF